MMVLSATASGVTNSYQYDALKRLTNVIDKRLGTNITYGFDGVGNLQTVSYPNGPSSVL